MRGRHRHGGSENSHADAPQVAFGRSRRSGIEHGVFVGETHEPRVGGEDVHVRAAAEGTGREGGREIAGIEARVRARPRGPHDDAPPPRRAVAPLGVGPLRPEDEHYAVIHGAGRDHAAARPVPRLVEHLDAAGLHLDPLDPVAVEHRSVGRRAHVVDDPPAVPRPDAGIREHVAVGCRGHLPRSRKP